MSAVIVGTPHDFYFLVLTAGPDASTKPSP